jgi:heme-degrading monooxygenase HmoA
MILRFFRAIIHDGKQAEFKTLFLGTALPNVRSQPGLVSVSVGLPRPESSTEFSMSMVWRDLEALKGFTGADWQKSVVDPAEAHLLKETHVYHYELHGDSTL